MRKILASIVVVFMALCAAAWGIDEHRPIQGSTTNPTPTGPTDHTPIQNKPETTVDTTIVTPTPPPPAPRLNPKKTKPKYQTKPQIGVDTSTTNPSGSTGTGTTPVTK